MFRKKDHEISVSLSLENFQNKEISNAMIGSSKIKENRIIRKKYGYPSMRGVSFVEVDITPSELLEKLLHGHVFCHCFNNAKMNIRMDGSFGASQKTLENFSHSYCIGVDIDFTSYTTIQEYLDQLTLKPTFWYSSYTHMKVDKKGYLGCKFRMLYVFDKPIDNIYWFKYISHHLIKIIEQDIKEKIEDKCSESPAQYFNGTNIDTTNGVEFGCNNIIYEVRDIVEDDSMYSDEFIEYLKNFCGYAGRDKNHKNRIKNLLEDLTYNQYVYNPTTSTFQVFIPEHKFKKIENSIDLIDDFEVIIPEDYLMDDFKEILWFWDNRTIDEFKRIRKWNIYREKYKYIYRKENVKWDDDYQIVGDDYFALPFYPKKLIDGEQRRKKLYQRCCLRKYMYPTIDKEELVFNYIMDVIRFIDDPNHDITSEVILKNIVSCMEQTVEDIENKYGEMIERYKILTRPKRNLIYKDKTKNTKETTFRIIDEYYNETFTVIENHELMNGLLPFPVSLNYLYEYTKSRGLKTDRHKVSDEELYNLIKTDLSVDNNLAAIRAKGLKCKKDRLSKILKNKRMSIPTHNDDIDSNMNSTPLFDILEERDVENPIIETSNDINLNELWDNITRFREQKEMEEFENYMAEKGRLSQMSDEEKLDEVISWFENGLI